MPTNLIGRFYFKKTSNGNLIGEFSNNYLDKASTESADLIKGDPANSVFLGQYNTTWQENAECRFAKLTISPKIGSNGLFSLSWADGVGNPLFIGEGMLCDNILIGDYLGADTAKQLDVYLKISR